jgi:predicted patatin/cPLA2 family phospholipase
MRGVLSAGALLALDLLGYRSCFDAVFATSAGSVNAAYFLSGQGELGMSVYFQDLNDRRFLNPWRLWKVLDVDYVYDFVVKVVKPLDEQAIRQSVTKLYLSVTAVPCGANLLVDVTSSDESIPLLLKASSALPVLYNRTVSVGDKLYVDGGVSGGPPLDKAIGLGFTDILYISTRSRAYVAAKPGMLDRLVFAVGMGIRFPSLMRAYRDSWMIRNRVERLASGSDQVGGVSIASFHAYPERTQVERTTTNPARLFMGAKEVALHLASSLGGDGDVIQKAFARLKPSVTASGS